MAWHEADKVKLSRPVEGPDDFTLLSSRNIRHVGHLYVREVAQSMHLKFVAEEACKFKKLGTTATVGLRLKADTQHFKTSGGSTA